ncbi:ATP-binding cassette domain-containing protein [Paenibacillus sp. alder61]|uniref:ABC transporter ATP-binding protein n=1 Tax=Paenibacillus sp. alder61 TaxID=2862948 RepID=UPI001CD1AC57|nr:ATP-binding cassette domain-containing protein [Paenibacillus sp. alder61]MCA1291510.1 ATP-binding cassette domain-containing protein [Paenibacillus sp. alder61]
MSSSKNSGLRVKELEVAYKSGELALGRVDFTLPEHGIYTILGPSGSGKSTLLRAVSGLLPEYRGELMFNGQPLRGQDVLIGLVPQNYGLLPWKTVKANIRVAMKIANPKEQDRRAREEQIDRWLTAMGIPELGERYPLSLSGGQQQRVAIARAFAIAPSILLLDEPFSALDVMTREALQQLFLEHWRANPTTALFVTHDVDEAILLGQKVIVLPSNKSEAPEMIDNEAVFGLEHAEKRASDAFFAQMKRIRKVMQEKW